VSVESSMTIRNNTKSVGQKGTTERMPPLREPDRLPGGRAALPADSLPKPLFGPQGNENRDPPQNAPAPVKHAATIAPRPPRPNGPRKASSC
jgi:hypothetical protein